MWDTPKTRVPPAEPHRCLNATDAGTVTHTGCRRSIYPLSSWLSRLQVSQQAHTGRRALISGVEYRTSTLVSNRSRVDNGSNRVNSCLFRYSCAAFTRDPRSQTCHKRILNTIGAHVQLIALTNECHCISHGHPFESYPGSFYRRSMGELRGRDCGVEPFPVATSCTKPEREERDLYFPWLQGRMTGRQWPTNPYAADMTKRAYSGYKYCL